METLRITGIDTARIGSPRNDSGPGSALYAVPFTMSRSMTAYECDAMVRVWDSPPQWTNMHRPGNLRASGNSVVIDGTTIEEVEKYHVATLKLVVDVVNVDSQAHEAGIAAKAQAEAQAEAAHRANVADVAKGIKFD